MESVLPVVLMLAAVLVSSIVAQIFPKAPASLVQIVLGVALAMSPAPVTITLDPDFFLIFFIAPLLYWDAIEADKKALWRQRRPVLALALGLVHACACAFYPACGRICPGCGPGPHRRSGRHHAGQAPLHR